MTLESEVLVAGTCTGPALLLAAPLSLWGGVDPATGTITDRHHPQAGRSVRGAVLVMERSRGSSSASSVLAEMIRAGTGPAGLVVAVSDPVLVLGAVVADELYDRTVPVVRLDAAQQAQLAGESVIHIDGRLVSTGQEDRGGGRRR